MTTQPASTNSVSNPSSQSFAGYLFVQTVSQNKARFHRREIEGADRAVVLHRKIGRPSQAQFEVILRNNLIRNCPVTVDDARRAIIIYGTDRASLQGKTVKAKGEHVPTFSAVEIPAPIVKDHENVTLATDFFFVQGLPFIHTISRKIKFRTITPVKSRKKEVMLQETKTVLDLYHARGFKVVDIHADMDFECIQDEVRPVLMNLNAHDDHVGEVERSIRTIKERVRADVHSMPFKRLPKMMVVELVRRAVLVLNQFPAQDGVSDTLSPLTIMTGKPSPDYHNMKVEFGTYVHVFEDNSPTNNNKSRTTGAIALNPTGNVQGDYHFMSLTTWKRLSRTQWTALPMPDAVIAAVEKRAEEEKQPLIIGGCPLFEWRPDNPVQMNAAGEIIDVDDDGPTQVEIDNANNTNPPDLPDDQQSYAEDADIDDDGAFVNEEIVAVDDTGMAWVDISDDDATTEGSDEVEADEGTADGDNINDAVADANNINGAEEEVDELGAENEDDDPQDDDPENTEADSEPFIIPRYHMRERRQRDYSHRLDHQMDVAASTKSYEPDHQWLQVAKYDAADKKTPQYIFGHVMTQMTATAGIKKHGQRAIDALLKEFCQLDDKSVFAAVDANGLSLAQKAAALRAINLIKEKRDGELKGRSCADGSAQRALYTKEQSASPTVSTDALMLSLMIDAKERRDVATADVVGAYLLADMDEFVLLKLTGGSVDIMCTVNETNKHFVVVELGKKVLYLQLLKALYGCVRSALLWYELFAGTLKGMGFILNPYDACVANKIVEGSQCTIAWYVDDTKYRMLSPKW